MLITYGFSVTKTGKEYDDPHLNLPDGWHHTIPIEAGPLSDRDLRELMTAMRATVAAWQRSVTQREMVPF